MWMVYSYHVTECATGCSFNVGPLRISPFLPFSYFCSGVDLFMVLSGFCLFFPLCKSEKALQSWSQWQFFTRRFWRIVPTYYGAIAYVTVLPIVLVLAFKILGLPAKWQPIPSAWQYISHLFFIHTFSPTTWAGISGPFWSLGVEMQFYLLFPLAILMYKRLGFRAFLAMIGISIAYRGVVGMFIQPSSHFEVVPFLWTINFVGRWMQFAAGMAAACLAAYCFRNGVRLNSWFGNSAVLLAAALFTAGLLWQLPCWLPMRELLLAASGSLLCFTLCTSRSFAALLLEHKVARWLGYISYSIYLIHQTSAWFLTQFLKRFLHLEGAVLALVMLTAGFAVVVLISYTFFLVFEKPFLERRTWRSKPKLSSS